MTTNNSTNNYTPMTTTGDVYIYGASAPTRLAVGSDYQVLQGLSSQSNGLNYDWPSPYLAKSSSLTWDGLGGNATTAENVPATSVTGTGAAVVIDLSTHTDGSTFGELQVQTGSTTTGRAYWRNNNTAIFVGSGQLIFESVVYIPTLSNGTDTYTANVGMSDGVVAGDFINAIYFLYTNGTNSGAWVCKTANSSTRTSLNSAITVTAGHTYRLRFVVNAAATSVEYYISDNGGAFTDVGAITTNIPTATPMQWNVGLTKSAGTNSLTMNTDYIWVRKDFTTAR